MSNKTNHRRQEEHRTEHGSRYENHENDRNSSRARSSWKRIAARSERRMGTVTPKYRNMCPGGHQSVKRHTRWDD